MAQLALSKVFKSYGELATVHGIDLDVASGEFIVLVGPSGCGKSTTLRMIAGLEDITDGEIRIGGKRVNELEPSDRDIAMVFQNYALYPHLSVADNIAFGLKLRGTPRDEIRRRVAETAAILGLEPLLERKPRQLSGGQRQRVAMGRALIRKPSVFLFDEPLSNLDAKLRVQMRTEIKDLHARVPTTTVYVTHDQIEAMTLADRVVVMNKGRIEQVAAPQELYSAPTTKFVAGFIGSPGMNFLPGRIEAHEGSPAFRLSTGDLLPLAQKNEATLISHRDKPMLAGVRPEHFRQCAGGLAPVTISMVEPLGMETLVHFMLAGEASVARLPPSDTLRPGTQLPLQVKSEHIHLIDPETERVVG